MIELSALRAINTTRSQYLYEGNFINDSDKRWDEQIYNLIEHTE